jgi:tetratricopeptide (TPR) repeat protein
MAMETGQFSLRDCTMNWRRHRLHWIGASIVLILCGLLLFAIIGRRPSLQTYEDRSMDAVAKGDVNGAIAILTEAIEHYPDNADLYYYRGNHHDMNGDLDRAIADYTEALRRNPRAALAYHGRGSAYRRNGDLSRAIADFTKALDVLDPSEKYATVHKAVFLSTRGKTYQAANKLDRAITDFTEMIQIDPYDAQAYVLRAQAYRAAGDEEKAASDARKTKELGQ